MESMNPVKQEGWFSRIFSKNREEKTAEQAPSATSILQKNQFALNLEKLVNARIEDIAVPKADIIALPREASLEDFYTVMRDHGYSRIPIFQDSLDEPLGLVHVKDVFMTYGVQVAADEFSLEAFIRPVIYAPPSMRLLTLLQKMQNEHVHMALVIDEYGGVDGLLTIEDILEQIVGDITDEHDDEEEVMWVLEKPGVYLVSARMPIEDFMAETEQSLHIPEESEDVDTIGGLISTIASRVPAKGEVIKLNDGAEFEIVAADLRRIQRVRIRFAQERLQADI